MSSSAEEAPESLDELVRPHVDSFDYFLGEGLQTIVDLLEPVEVLHPFIKHFFIALDSDCIILHSHSRLCSCTEAALHLYIFPAD